MIVESIPLQQKIAQLEERVAALEKAHGVRYVTTITETVTSSKIFGEHWDKMWHHFHEMMKEAFH
jgi:hypothetical protein